MEALYLYVYVLWIVVNLQQYLHLYCTCTALVLLQVHSNPQYYGLQWTCNSTSASIETTIQLLVH